MERDITIMFMVKNGRKESIEVSAQSDNMALAIITAGTIEEASKLLPKAEGEANKAMDEYVAPPVKEVAPIEEQKHFFAFSNHTVEDAKADIERFKATPHGKKFIESQVKNFMFESKHTDGYTFDEYSYYMNLLYMGKCFEALDGISATSYKRGYKCGYKNAKKKG